MVGAHVLASAADDLVFEALRVYDTLRSRLRHDLGVTPSRVTQDLHRRLLR
jgi:DNA-binding SARP family transcriptional activator